MEYVIGIASDWAWMGAWGMLGSLILESGKWVILGRNNNPLL